MEIHCTCHQLLSKSCFLFRDLLLVSIEGGTLSHTDSQFLYTGIGLALGLKLAGFKTLSSAGKEDVFY